MTEARTLARESDPGLREQLSNLRGLLLFSVLMTECDDENQIAHLATSSIPSLGTARLRALYIEDGGWRALDGPRAEPALGRLEAQLHALDGVGGPVRIPGDGWAWAYALGGGGGSFLIVGAPSEPSTENRFLVQVLAQETGIALANARLHAQERATAKQLEETVRALRRSMEIHKRLTQVAVRGEGQVGLAHAIHELTGYPVAIEDRYGNLRAWAGPDRPQPYPKEAAPQRDRLLHRLIRNGRPTRDRGRLVALARPGGDLLGVIALVDPRGACGEHELVALEHGATILAMELARLRSLAEADLRRRRDLVESLLDGTDDETVQSRAQGLGYDLGRCHRVVIAEGQGRTGDDDVFFHAVRRAAHELSVGTLMIAHQGVVLVLASKEVPWEAFRQAAVRELGGGRCRLGVGGLCERPAEFARSRREAELALRIDHACSRADRATSFDDLGVYRLLSEVQDLGTVEEFVRDRLGGLLDHDSRKNSDLVRTLTMFLEHGGNYVATAEALYVHPSTLKYRLQRIRSITRYDLNDPDTRFSLQLSTRAWQTLVARREEEVPPRGRRAGRSAPPC